MLDWLYEGKSWIYVLLGAVGCAFLYAWYRNQKKKWLWSGVAIAIAGAGFYWVLDRAVETDLEQVQRKVQEMAAAVEKKDLDAAFRHFSEKFRSPGGRAKQVFKDTVEKHLKSTTVTGVIVWDFDFPERPDRLSRKANVSFMVKAVGGSDPLNNIPARCEAVFELDPTQGWQLLGFELFNPQTNNERLPFPF